MFLNAPDGRHPGFLILIKRARRKLSILYLLYDEMWDQVPCGWNRKGLLPLHTLIKFSVSNIYITFQTIRYTPLSLFIHHTLLFPLFFCGLSKGVSNSQAPFFPLSLSFMTECIESRDLLKTLCSFVYSLRNAGKRKYLS